MSNLSDSICQTFEVNSLCFRMIDCYLSARTFPANFQCLDLKELLYQTLRELFLSETETLGWLILLDEIGLKICSIPQKLVLIYTALKAKVHLGAAVFMEILRLESKYPTLTKDFKAWSVENITDGIITTPKLGKRYRELNLPYTSDTINYNFYVDYVIGVSPKYSSYIVFQDKKIKKRIKIKSTCVHDANFIDEREFERIDGC
ncbi:hypothetical protein SteCoe_3219 [Stentor coeruleus]|uniref:Uncharacterized protein n=1 Tax=Stentor coeruleus TaxID=5963 RepID=A0A1R2CXS1_9CILI|nr:hypothetical protein SteCoe_3219 [Stentor coeruleus]